MPRTAACVILDANAWYGERLLRSGMGAALIHLVLKLGWRIGLPETVEKETCQRLLDLGIESSKETRDGLRLLEHLTGSAIKAQLPSEEVLRRGIQDRWTELDTILEKLPLTLEIARAALDRVVRKTPPSGKSEQFRDCCLWEQLLEIAKKREVHLVTDDGDFYEKGQLASALQADCSKSSHTIKVYRRVVDLVTSLEEPTPLPEEQRLAIKIAALLEPGLKKGADDREFELGELVRFSVKSVPTDRPTALALTYELVFALVDRGGQRTATLLTATGTATLDPTTQSISELHPDRESFDWVDAQGEKQHSGNVYMYARIKL